MGRAACRRHLLSTEGSLPRRAFLPAFSSLARLTSGSRAPRSSGDGGGRLPRTWSVPPAVAPHLHGEGCDMRAGDGARGVVQCWRLGHSPALGIWVWRNGSGGTRHDCGPLTAMADAAASLGSLNVLSRGWVHGCIWGDQDVGQGEPDARAAALCCRCAPPGGRAATGGAGARGQTAQLIIVCTRFEISHQLQLHDSEDVGHCAAGLLGASALVSRCVTCL